MSQLKNTRTRTGKRIGRPPAKVDPDQVRTLAGIMCTQEEIAAVVKCSVDTLARRFADEIKTGRMEGKASLRRHQYQRAVNGSDAMLIWLGKQYLDQKEPNRYEIEEQEFESTARAIIGLVSSMRKAA